MVKFSECVYVYPPHIKIDLSKIDEETIDYLSNYIFTFDYIFDKTKNIMTLRELQ